MRWTRSGLSARAFGVYWQLRDDDALRHAGVSAREIAEAAEAEFARFPNARVNEDERRRLRAALYRPLLAVDRDERGRVVDAVLAGILGGDADVDG